MKSTTDDCTPSHVHLILPGSGQPRTPSPRRPIQLQLQGHRKFRTYLSMQNIKWALISTSGTLFTAVEGNASLSYQRKRRELEQLWVC